MSELYLIRHAQASFGAQNYDQLSDLGFKQAQLLGQHFAKMQIQFDHVITGSLKRQIQTAEAIGRCISLPQSTIVSEFNEYRFEAMNQAYANKFPNDELVEALKRNPKDKKGFFRLLRRVLIAWSKNHIDTEESFDSFCKRIARAQTHIQGLANPGNRILVISSGGAICQFVGNVLAIQPEQSFELNLQIRNTAISQFFFNHKRLCLSSFNSTPHLESILAPELITYG